MLARRLVNKFLKNFANFSGKKPTLQALRPANFLKRDFNTNTFP